MEEFIKRLEKMELKENKNAIQQTQRNQLRSEFLKALESYFKKDNYEVYQTIEGLVLDLFNEDLGDIFIVLKPVIKGLDYDLKTEIEDYETREKTREEKEKKKEEKRKATEK